jgi:DNA-binding transcriptional LysR family regulator
MAALPRITLEQWQALVAVVDAGSYDAAAQALHKSQSTLSYAIQRIEALLGVEVFERRGRRAVLTPTGAHLQRRARQLLDEAGGLERAAKSLSAGWEAEIRIAAEIAFPSALLLECLDRFGAESPHTRIEVVESVLAGTAEALVAHRADLAIGGVVPQGFVGEPLMRMRMVIAAHPAHPLHALGRDVTIRDLRRHRQLVIRESDAKRATRPQLEAEQRWTVSHAATSALAASRGYGYGWYAEERIRDEVARGTLRPLPMAEGGVRFVELYLMFGDRENAGPGVLRLAQLLRERTAACPAEPPLGKPEARRGKAARG